MKIICIGLVILFVYFGSTLIMKPKIETFDNHEHRYFGKLPLNILFKPNSNLAASKSNYPLDENILGKPSYTKNIAECKKKCIDNNDCKSITYVQSNPKKIHCILSKEGADKGVIRSAFFKNVESYDKLSSKFVKSTKYTDKIFKEPADKKYSNISESMLRIEGASYIGITPETINKTQYFKDIIVTYLSSLCDASETCISFSFFERVGTDRYEYILFNEIPTETNVESITNGQTGAYIYYKKPEYIKESNLKQSTPKNEAILDIIEVTGINKTDIIEKCESMCTNNIRCKSFTYVPSIPDDVVGKHSYIDTESNKCVLTNVDTSVLQLNSKYNNSVSLNKLKHDWIKNASGQTNIELLGNTHRDNTKNSSELQCRDKCSDNDTCKAYRFKKDNGNQCYKLPLSNKEYRKDGKLEKVGDATTYYNYYGKDHNSTKPIPNFENRKINSSTLLEDETYTQEAKQCFNQKNKPLDLDEPLDLDDCIDICNNREDCKGIDFKDNKGVKDSICRLSNSPLTEQNTILSDGFVMRGDTNSEQNTKLKNSCPFPNSGKYPNFLTTNNTPTPYFEYTDVNSGSHCKEKCLKDATCNSYMFFKEDHGCKYPKKRLLKSQVMESSPSSSNDKFKSMCNTICAGVRGNDPLLVETDDNRCKYKDGEVDSICRCYKKIHYNKCRKYTEKNPEEFECINDKTCNYLPTDKRCKETCEYPKILQINGEILNKRTLEGYKFKDSTKPYYVGGKNIAECEKECKNNDTCKSMQIDTTINPCKLYDVSPIKVNNAGLKSIYDNLIEKDSSTTIYNKEKGSSINSKIDIYNKQQQQRVGLAINHKDISAMSGQTSTDCKTECNNDRECAAFVYYTKPRNECDNFVIIDDKSAIIKTEKAPDDKHVHIVNKDTTFSGGVKNLGYNFTREFEYPYDYCKYPQSSNNVKKTRSKASDYYKLQMINKKFDGIEETGTTTLKDCETKCSNYPDNKCQAISFNDVTNKCHLLLVPSTNDQMLPIIDDGSHIYDKSSIRDYSDIVDRLLKDKQVLTDLGGTLQKDFNAKMYESIHKTEGDKKEPIIDAINKSSKLKSVVNDITDKYKTISESYKALSSEYINKKKRIESEMIKDFDKVKSMTDFNIDNQKIKNKLKLFSEKINIVQAQTRTNREYQVLRNRGYKRNEITVINIDNTSNQYNSNVKEIVFVSLSSMGEQNNYVLSHKTKGTPTSAIAAKYEATQHFRIFNVKNNESYNKYIKLSGNYKEEHLIDIMDTSIKYPFKIISSYYYPGYAVIINGTTILLRPIRNDLSQQFDDVYGTGTQC